MATLKDHQQAMVDLLASGSGIPASASRLAHAVFDILGKMLDGTDPVHESMERFLREEATTPGLNDAALAGDLEAVRPKVKSAERRVKELENTCGQLRNNIKKLKTEIGSLEYKLAKSRLSSLSGQQGLNLPEQSGCRKPDTQVCDHEFNIINGNCCKCGVAYVAVCGEDKYK